jgi:uncharacterized small protein (DUF1192 family)
MYMSTMDWLILAGILGYGPMVGLVVGLAKRKGLGWGKLLGLFWPVTILGFLTYLWVVGKDKKVDGEVKTQDVSALAEEIAALKAELRALKAPSRRTRKKASGQKASEGQKAPESPSEIPAKEDIGGE